MDNVCISGELSTFTLYIASTSTSKVEDYTIIKSNISSSESSHQGLVREMHMVEDIELLFDGRRWSQDPYHRWVALLFDVMLVLITELAS